MTQGRRPSSDAEAGSLKQGGQSSDAKADAPCQDASSATQQAIGDMVEHLQSLNSNSDEKLKELVQELLDLPANQNDGTDQIPYDPTGNAAFGPVVQDNSLPWMVSQYGEVAEYISQNARLSPKVTWQGILEAHIGRAKVNGLGGPIVSQSITDLKQVEVDSQTGRHRCTLTLPHSWNPNDMYGFGGQGEGVSEKTSIEAACKVIMTELILRDALNHRPNSRICLVRDDWNLPLHFF